MPASLSQLRNFMALAESGSFTRGAGQSSRSQAAFSRSIAVLESNLGVTLVDRAGHRNVLTPIGRTVLEHARQVVAEADALLQVVRHHTSGDAGHVRIGLGSTPSALLTRPLLTYASRHSSTMRLELSRGPIEMQLQLLRERKLDALVVDARYVAGASDVVLEPLCDLATGLLCRPGHPLAGNNHVELGDLQKFPVGSTYISRAVAQKMADTFGPGAHPGSLVTLYCEDVVGLLGTVAETDAIYMGVVAPAQALLATGSLVRIPFETTEFASRVGWVRRSGSVVSPVLVSLREHIVQILTSAQSV